jgi:hypothetical protein
VTYDRSRFVTFELFDASNSHYIVINNRSLISIIHVHKIVVINKKFHYLSRICCKKDLGRDELLLSVAVYMNIRKSDALCG